MGYLKKEDVQKYELLSWLCCRSYFSEKRFQFLLDWDPDALRRFDECGVLSLHWAASQAIKGFKIVFDAGLRYYPEKRGILLLFTLAAGIWRGKTPFQLACEKHGREAVAEIVDDVLKDRSSQHRPDHTYIEAFLSAAVDDRIDLNGLYFIFRKSPHVLQQLLQQPTTIGAATRRRSKRRKLN